jgi:hypothetical protein
MIPMLIFSALLAGAPVSAQQTGPADAQKSEEQAKAIMKRMANFLSQAKGFSVMVDTGFDTLQEFGQKLEFGETRQIVLIRPDRLRVDATKRDGSKKVISMKSRFILRRKTSMQRMPGRHSGSGC